MCSLQRPLGLLYLCSSLRPPTYVWHLEQNKKQNTISRCPCSTTLTESRQFVNLWTLSYLLAPHPFQLTVCTSLYFFVSRRVDRMITPSSEPQSRRANANNHPSRKANKRATKRTSKQKKKRQQELKNENETKQGLSSTTYSTIDNVCEWADGGGEEEEAVFLGQSQGIKMYRIKTRVHNVARFSGGGQLNDFCLEDLLFKSRLSASLSVLKNKNTTIPSWRKTHCVSKT